MAHKDPVQRQITARIGAHARWANTTDRAGALAPARRGMDERFEREVDPDGVMDLELRQRLARNAKSKYYAQLQLKSAKARSARSGHREAS
jgi:hypothetical protein